jgi:hypothetical protein
MADEGLLGSRESGTYWQRRVQRMSCQERITPHFAFPEKLIEDFDDDLMEVADGLCGADAVKASGEYRTRFSTAQASEFHDRILRLVAEYNVWSLSTTRRA